MSDVAVLDGFKKFVRYYGPDWKFRKKQNEHFNEYQLATKLTGAGTKLVLSFVNKHGKPIVYVQYAVRVQTEVQAAELAAVSRANRRLAALYKVRLTRGHLSDGREFVRVERSLPKGFYLDPFEMHRTLQSFIEYLERFMPMYYSVWELSGQGEQIRLWANPGSRMVH